MFISDGKQFLHTGNFNRHMGRAFDVLLGRGGAPDEDDEDDATITPGGGFGGAAKRPRLTTAAPRGGASSSNANNQQGVRIPVPPGRFQRLRVDDNCAIKEFVVNTGIVFKVGKGFYELTKSEEVGVKKEIVLEELATGKCCFKLSTSVVVLIVWFLLG